VHSLELSAKKSACYGKKLAKCPVLIQWRTKMVIGTPIALPKRVMIDNSNTILKIGHEMCHWRVTRILKKDINL
jgi:hypothetical protein